MPKVILRDEQFNIYVRFLYTLNVNKGRIFGNSAVYYDFLDSELIEHKQFIRILDLVLPRYKNNYDSMYPYVHYRTERDSKTPWGEFYLTTDGRDIVCNLSKNAFPPLIKIRKPKPKQEIEQELEPEAPTVESCPDVNPNWTREDVVALLTKEAHIVGRMLGNGYDLLEEIHGDWLREWLLNPNDFKIVIHQAHRGSFKSTCLRLMIAIFMILKPLVTVIVVRKSEDAVKELVGGVSKILDTPLFHAFVNILYPDIAKKGGFKKVTDTALAIDTNLNTNLSGEMQLRALGLGSPLTGKHAELIITDDIVTTDDRISPAARMETIYKYQELMNVLSSSKAFKDSRILNIGTPWHEEDAFSLMEKGLPDKSNYQLRLERIPAKQRTDNQNEMIRKGNMARGLFVYNCYQTGLMTEEEIQRKKKTLNDDVLFAANYMLSLVSDDEKPFPKINNTSKYSNSFFDEAWEVYAQIDCSYGGADSTALSIGAFNWDTHEAVVYGKLYKGVSIDENYLDLLEEMTKCNVTMLFLESNADKGLMGEKFREFGMNVISYHESTNKHNKIITSIRPYWRESAEEYLPCLQFTKETDSAYLSQIHDYKQGVKHDDAPDSLAVLLIKAKFSNLPIRIT